MIKEFILWTMVLVACCVYLGFQLGMLYMHRHYKKGIDKLIDKYDVKEDVETVKEGN